MEDYDFGLLLLCSLFGLVIGIVIGSYNSTTRITDNCILHEEKIYCTTEIDDLKEGK